MKKTQKNVTRKLSDWRSLYYSFKGARLIINIESLLAIGAILAYKFYHWLFISQSYYQDHETTWLLIPIFALLALMFILTMIQGKIEGNFKAAIREAKKEKKRNEMTVERLLEAIENAPTMTMEELERMSEPETVLLNQQ